MREGGMAKAKPGPNPNVRKCIEWFDKTAKELAP